MRNRTLLILALTLLAIPAMAFEVEVVVENVSPGIWMTPAWVGFHMGTFDTYDGGVSLDGFPGMEALVEDGNTGPLSDDFALQTPLGIQGTIPGPNGPIMVGDKAVMRFNIFPSYHRYFSYASMVIPSNDAFVANGNPTTHRVFDTDGEFTPIEFYILGSENNDGGTEVNDELPSSTAALGQSSPNTGTDENGVVVTPHPGFIPGGRILQAFPNGDFNLPGFRLAKVTVRAAPTTRIGFGASAAQEVPTNDSTAVAACYGSLNDAQNQLNVRCEHNVTNTVTAAHVHLGAPGENGDVIFPFDDATTNPIMQTFDVTADQVANFFAGNYYVNIHSDVYPGGEIRGQVNGCFEGPNGLCLNGERFQVTATFADFEGNTGTAKAIQGTRDSGFFYFFGPDNIELDVKVIDGCENNNYFWVFTAGTTNVEVNLTVTDTLTGQVQNYSNALGSDFQPILDTAAFATCP